MLRGSAVGHAAGSAAVGFTIDVVAAYRPTWAGFAIGFSRSFRSKNLPPELTRIPQCVSLDFEHMLARAWRSTVKHDHAPV
jgi:hypothetical protein